jgi:VanZ family protein
MRRAPAHSIVAWLSVGVIALIAYGSLYPFNLKHVELDIWSALSQLSWARAGRGDRVSNVLLYAPLGFCVFLYLDGRVRRRAAIVSALLVGVALSLAIEVAQVFISSRVSSLWDVTLNSCGTAAGVIGGMAWHALSARLIRSDAGAGYDNRGAWCVLALWFGWRWAPFHLQLDLGKFKAALQPLTNPEFETWPTLHYLVWWIVVAQILFTMVNRTRATESLLAVIAATLIGRLFFAEPALIASELLALLLLLPMLVVLHKLSGTPRQWLVLTLFATLSVWDALSPWQFGAASSFDLWPFMAWIQAGMPVDSLWLLRQAFLYAALAWLLNNTGASPRTILFIVPGAVLAIEVMQLWLPEQRSSITEPALALAVVAGLKMLWTAKSRRLR